MAARKARFSAGLTDWSTLEAAHPAKFDIGQRGGRQANPCALPLARGGARAKAFAKPLSPSLSEPVTLLTCSLNHSLAPSLSTLLLFPLSSFPPSTLPRGFRRTSGTLAAWRRRGLRAIWVTIPSQFLLFFSFFLLLPFLFFFFVFIPSLLRRSRRPQNQPILILPSPASFHAHVQPTTHRITFSTNPLQRWNETMVGTMDIRWIYGCNRGKTILVFERTLFFPLFFPPVTDSVPDIRSIGCSAAIITRTVGDIRKIGNAGPRIPRGYRVRGGRGSGGGRGKKVIRTGGWKRKGRNRGLVASSRESAWADSAGGC